METRRLYAIFTDELAWRRSVSHAREAGLTIEDAYLPYPVHGIGELLGHAPNRIPWACFAGGLFGLASAFGLQLWISAINWPINIGGKTHTAVPALVPVAFELTILFAALATLAAFFAGEKLWPGRAAPPLPAAATDRHFVLLVASEDTELDEMTRILEGCGAQSVEPVTEDRS